LVPAELQERKDLDAMGVYEVIAINDIQDAADILRPVYNTTKMRDGYVSLEVSAGHAYKGDLAAIFRSWPIVNSGRCGGPLANRESIVVNSER
jgi:hypothetical protein